MKFSTKVTSNGGYSSGRRNGKVGKSLRGEGRVVFDIRFFTSFNLLFLRFNLNFHTPEEH